VYIRGHVLPLFCLSFFPPHTTSCTFIQYNHVLFLPLLPGPLLLCQSSPPPCPHPRLAKPPHLRPHRAKPRPSRAPIRITKSRVFRCALSLHHIAAPSTPVPAPEFPSPLPSSRPHPPRVSWIPFLFLARLLHYVASLSSTELARCPSQLPSPTLLAS
jgi:hypothetical protein